MCLDKCSQQCGCCCQVSPDSTYLVATVAVIDLIGLCTRACHVVELFDVHYPVNCKGHIKVKCISACHKYSLIHCYHNVSMFEEDLESITISIRLNEPGRQTLKRQNSQCAVVKKTHKAMFLPNPSFKERYTVKIKCPVNS